MSTWIQTYTGKKFEALSPTEDMIDINDIAHALSLMCRYNGHVKRFYSVAEHSVLLSTKASVPNQLCALLHDGSETYIADIARPIKPSLKNYKKIEDGIMTVVAKKYGFSWPVPEEVQQLDNRILIDEKEQLLGPSPEAWDDWANGMPRLGVQVGMMNSLQAEDAFLRRFWELGGNARRD